MTAEEEIAGWADLELAAWRGYDLRGQALADALRQQSTKHSVFLFDIQDEEVSFDDKAVGHFAPSGMVYREIMVNRSAGYRDLIAEGLRRIGHRGSGTLAIELEDLGWRRFAMPMFAFQKLASANTILLPDPDFFGWGFYEDPAHVDALAFDEKSDRAVFVGSTTGDLPITAGHVIERRNARVRAAAFFKDHANVTFSLPNIVQCEPDAAELIRELDVGGAWMDWSEQIAGKYILSMDGNGATCSRVVLALKSNGVLLKYLSDYRLYYFHGLVPWQHYVPVGHDEDVLDTLANAPHNMALYRDIAERSRSFAETRLSRDAVVRYTGAVVSRYLDRFFG